MRARTWKREEVIRELSDRIWSYLTPAAQSTQAGLFIAEALLHWPYEDAARMGELQFLMSDEVGDFLTSLPALLRALTISSAQDEEWDHERLRGPIRWSKTLALRMTGASRRLWVTAPAKRDYHTPENQMIVYLLDRIVEIGRISRWTESDTAIGDAGQKVQPRVRDAEHRLQNRMLASIDRQPLSPRSLSQVRTGRGKQRYESAIRAYDTYQSLVHNLEKNAVRTAVEKTGMAAAEPGVLFELLCLFNTIDALNAAGWSMRPLGLVQGGVRVRGCRYGDDTRKIDIFYQWTPSDLPSSLYKTLQFSHGIKNAIELRPDMYLRWTAPDTSSRWLIVECKYRSGGLKGTRKAARDALQDLLAYRRAFHTVFQARHEPYGLGMIWGAELVPDPKSEIMLATPDSIGQAISMLVV